jgi:hypothetical protein
MRNRFFLTRIILALGLWLALNNPAWSQDSPAQEALPANDRTVTVAGLVRGPATSQETGALAVLLLPGWSEALSSDVAAGTAPTVLLQSGRMELAPAQSDKAAPAQRPWAFEFRNVPPGEYQAVVIRLKDGADAGAAIAVSNRVVVAGTDIADLNIEITARLDPVRARQGSAAKREAAVIGTITRPPPDMIGAQPTVPAPLPQPARGRKREILEQVLVTAGVVAAMVAFSMW